MRTKKFLIAAVAVGALTLSACSSGGGGDAGGDSSAQGDGGLIGIAMPTKSIQRWIQDGDELKQLLEAEGYTVDLQYADDDVPTQVSQVENMLTKGAEALIVAAVDGTTLSEVLQEAAGDDIPVIAYDRLIRDTENVNYYASFDNFKVGQQQAWSVLNGLGLTELDGTPIDGAPAGPFNLEVFFGSPDDNNATFLWDGGMQELQPYIDNDTLVIQSGQNTPEQAATLGWDPEKAQSRMENILTSSYSDGSKVDAVLSPNDGLARGIISAFTDAGYAVGPDWPIIPGQDAEIDSVKALVGGEQYATIFKDTRNLAKTAAGMVTAALNGEEPEVNNTTDYDNGVKVIPSFLLEPVIVTTDNLTEVLVDSGYYTEDQISG